MLQKIKVFLHQGNRFQWCLFILFALTIFIKCILFHWVCFHSVLVSSLWKQPLAFLTFYANKIPIALFIASFIFLSKHHWWTIIVSLTIDIWAIANILYFNANGLFIDVNAMCLIGELGEFKSSIATYFDSVCLVFVFITIVYSLIYILLRTDSRINIKSFFCVLGICIPLYIYAQYNNYYRMKWIDTDSIRFYKENGGCDTDEDFFKIYGMYGERCFIPYYQILMQGTESTNYIKERSFITYFPCIFFNYYYQQHQLTESRLQIGDIEQTKINTLCTNQPFTATKLTPTSNLIIILVESLESWAITSVNEENIMPNLSELINKPSVVYFPHLKSQVKHGVSGDGQMIINTGLLPISNGSAANEYGENVFPNIAHFYKESYTVAPSDTWNQPVVTYSYGYKNLISPDNSRSWQDDSICYKSQLLLDLEQPYCIQTITLSSHTPFDRVKHKIPLPTDMPKYMHDYLCALHYTDSCVGRLLKEIQEMEQTLKTTIIITGDHTIFKDKLLREFAPCAQKYDLAIKDGKNFVPLIVLSPQIKENIHITDTCYQMDIYPTIMHLIGCEDYYWKGFGVNLLDSAARHNRPSTEEESYQLSDKLIRSNYFATIDK